MKLILILFTIFAGALVNEGCVRRAEHVTTPSEATADHATVAMDQGRYEDAVNELTAYLAANPGDTRVRSLLSNAYVRWGGIKFNDFIPLAKFYVSQSAEAPVPPGPTATAIRILRAGGGAPQNTAAHALEALQKLLTTLSTVVIVFDIIPEVDEAQYDHFSRGLAQAIAANSSTKGDVLYRVLLRVIDLKFNWLHQGAFHFMDAQCKVVPDRLADFFADTFSRYQIIATELGFVFPNLGNSLNQDFDQYKKMASEFKLQLVKINGTAHPSLHLRSVWDCM